MTAVHQVMYGGIKIEFQLERRDRVTLEISVLSDSRVLVVAPELASLDEISARVRKRARWVQSQQRYFAQFAPRTPVRRYVPGETHLYLGRQYRLRLQPGEERKVRMLRGFIQVEGVDFDDSVSVKRLVTAWYHERAKVQLPRRLEINYARFAEPDRFRPIEVRLQRMSSRWGSMSPSGRLLLNPELVRAPVDAIDYVITHELCHLAVPNHSRQFYDQQRQVMPDWEQRKLRLERALA